MTPQADDHEKNDGSVVNDLKGSVPSDPNPGDHRADSTIGTNAQPGVQNIEVVTVA